MTDTYDPLASVGGTASTPAPKVRLAAPQTGPEELAAITEVLESGMLTNGPYTRRFEDAMAARQGTAHAVALANGTVALTAMLLASGIGPGDEVIVPSISFFATASAVAHVGATPVFSDIEADTLNLDLDTAAAAITPRTRAIIPVHYAGQPADMAGFRAVADDHGLVLLEDAAQAHGATVQGRGAGAWGDAAMFSFTPTKNITTGEGAIVTTDDAALAQRIRLLRNHGMSAPYVHDLLGFNWRLSELQAAMGVVQLDRLDRILEQKSLITARLRDDLSGVAGLTLLAERPDRMSSRMIFTVRIADGRRGAVMDALDHVGVEHRIYFPPLPLQAPFRHLPRPDLPVTTAVAQEILSIPCHVDLREADMDLIVSSIVGALDR